MIHNQTAAAAAATTSRIYPQPQLECGQNLVLSFMTALNHIQFTMATAVKILLHRISIWRRKKNIKLMA